MKWIFLDPELEPYDVYPDIDARQWHVCRGDDAIEYVEKNGIPTYLSLNFKTDRDISAVFLGWLLARCAGKNVPVISYHGNDRNRANAMVAFLGRIL